MTVTAAVDTAVSSTHEHAWRLVQVDYTDGCCVREFACGECSAVWFS